jgi:hypothetical protein
LPPIDVDMPEGRNSAMARVNQCKAGEATGLDISDILASWRDAGPDTIP